MKTTLVIITLLVSTFLFGQEVDSFHVNNIDESEWEAIQRGHVKVDANGKVIKDVTDSIWLDSDGSHIMQRKLKDGKYKIDTFPVEKPKVKKPAPLHIKAGTPGINTAPLKFDTTKPQALAESGRLDFSDTGVYYLNPATILRTPYLRLEDLDNLGGQELPFKFQGSVTEFEKSKKKDTSVIDSSRHDPYTSDEQIQEIIDRSISNLMFWHSFDQPKRDTLPLNLLVTDMDPGWATTEYHIRLYDQAQQNHKMAFGIQGYVVREQHEWREGGIHLIGQETYWKNLYYLDENKKELPESIIVWQAKERTKNQKN